MKKTLLIAAVAALLSMTVVAIGGGTVITQPIGQHRVTGTCSSPNGITAIAADGTVTCATGAGTTDGDKGDVTVSSSGATWTIDNGVVSFAKQADVATSRIIGRVTSGTGSPEALTGTQATTLLDSFTSSLKGLAPASGGGTTNYLRADGSWSSPPGLGDITGVTVTSPACSAGSFMTGLTGGATSGDAPVGGTCTGEVGDISAVVVTDPGCSAGSFVANLTGGATSGSAPVGGTCVAEVGDISSVTAGDGLTGGGTSGAVTLDVVGSSDFSVGANLIDLSNDVDFPGIVGLAVTEYGAGGLATTINNLAPSAKGVVHIQCGDNEGTRITGIDATGYNVGDVLYVENTDGTQDDSVCVLRHENTGSTATNRFSTPEERDFYLGPQQGALAIRLPILDGSAAPTADIRWKVIATPRSMRALIQNLHLFPRLDVGVATPISGTFDNWQPTGDPLGSAWGEAGNNLTWLDSTAIRVATNAAGATITGMYWGGNGPTTADMGAVKVITNYGPGSLTFKHDNSGSSADYRMNLPCTRDLVLGAGDTLFAYHSVTWQIIPSKPTQLCAARATVTATDANNPAIDVTMVSGQTQGIQIANSATGQTPSGGVSNGIKVSMTGTYNATSSSMSPSGITSICTATRSAGANTVDCHALTVQATGCSGGTCRAMYASGGEVRLASGSPFVAGDSSDLVGAVRTYGDNRFGDANPDTTTIWGHLAARGTDVTVGVSCGTSPTVQSGSTDIAGVITTGSGATACTVTFSRTMTNAPSCNVTMRDGTQQANIVYTTSATALTLSTAPASQTFDYHCTCIGTGCT